MGSLTDLNLRAAYHKGEDDIAREFYLPCMDRAISYDRAVGFFSSTIYAIAWRSLREFVQRGGKMRMICSPILSVQDADAIDEGYSARAEARNGESLRDELRRMLGNPQLVKPARILASLVAMGVLDIKIAWVGRGAPGSVRRLFHDKLGVFEDKDRNVVAFKGSMNETWAGLSYDGNLESVDVYLSWGGERENARIENERAYFERLWSGEQYPGVTTVPFPDVAKQDLVDAARVSEWERLVDDVCAEIDTAFARSADRGPDARVPRPHQLEALDNWEAQGRRGILEHATGSGKTFTALCAMRSAAERRDVMLVVVPSVLLLEQWENEIRRAFSDRDPQLLVCGGGHKKWADSGRLQRWTRQQLVVRPEEPPRVILATIQTAASETFRRRVKDGSHLFLIADEVHRVGTPSGRQLLDLQTGARLGLSATPHRAGDSEGTNAILEYFGGVVPPPFTLQDAIAARTLTPYTYHVHTIQLSDTEQESWDNLTAEIKSLYARARQERDADRAGTMNARVKRLLIDRSRIAKQASGKPGLASSILSAHYAAGQHWLVYCDDQSQLRQVREALEGIEGRRVLEYHSAMDGDREQTLALFRSQGGIVVSIRCLDEGVDIPDVTHALILASSRNRREFVQRRGRVLRRAPGKTLAHIHDAVVLPIPGGQDQIPGQALLEGELVRAIEFGSAAINPACISDLQSVAARFGLDVATLTNEGFEEDD